MFTSAYVEFWLERVAHSSMFLAGNWDTLKEKLVSVEIVFGPRFWDPENGRNISSEFAGADQWEIAPMLKSDIRIIF